MQSWKFPREGQSESSSQSRSIPRFQHQTQFFYWSVQCLYFIYLKVYDNGGGDSSMIVSNPHSNDNSYLLYRSSSPRFGAWPGACTDLVWRGRPLRGRQSAQRTGPWARRWAWWPWRGGRTCRRAHHELHKVRESNLLISAWGVFQTFSVAKHGRSFPPDLKGLAYGSNGKPKNKIIPSRYINKKESITHGIVKKKFSFSH